VIESWMRLNRLKMNTDKTDFIWLSSKHQLAKIQSQSIALESVHVPVSPVLASSLTAIYTFTPTFRVSLVVVSTIFGSYGL